MSDSPPLHPRPPEQDVLLALSEEVHRLEAEKKGATIDLPQYFQAKARVARNCVSHHVIDQACPM